MITAVEQGYQCRGDRGHPGAGYERILAAADSGQLGMQCAVIGCVVQAEIADGVVVLLVLRDKGRTLEDRQHHGALDTFLAGVNETGLDIHDFLLRNLQRDFCPELMHVCSCCLLRIAVKLKRVTGMVRIFGRSDA